ncbi:MAG TPA: response regulator, partial [Rhodospirillaceae bacterium]|nr:response regulator [Rhodospirillaceae bacterium]
MVKVELDFSRLTILIVDDQDYVRSIVVQLLRSLGVGKVVEGASGDVAIQILETTKADLILCDIKMKPMDGLQFLREVRSGKGQIDSQVPIIFLTAASDQTTVQEAITLGIDGYMVKPVSGSILKEKITTVMQKR